MLKDLRSTTRLNNGVEMPWLGLGVFKVKEGEEVYSSVKHAIQYGYKSIDTAAVYGNEEGVGKAIQESGVPREELFITTKVWNANQGYDSSLQAFEDSRKKLGLVDCCSDRSSLGLTAWDCDDTEIHYTTSDRGECECL